MRRILIVGAGAVGSYVALQLGARADVVIVDEAASVLSAWRRRGAAVLHPAELSGAVRETDFALVATKSHQVARALAALPAGTPAAVLANGLYDFDALASSRILLAGVVDFAVHFERSGELRCSRRGSLTLERRPDRRADDATAHLVSALAPSDIRVRLTPQIVSFRWSKLLLNSALDPVAAAAGTTYGGVFARRERVALFSALLEEALEVARRLGVSLAPIQGLRPGTLARLVRTPGIAPLVARAAFRQASRIRSSMLQDLRLGRLTEVRELNGAIAGLARRLGVPVATHEAILATMVELEAGRERPGRQALARAAARAAAGARRVH